MIRPRRCIIAVLGAFVLGFAVTPGSAQAPDLVPLVRAVTPSVAYVLAEDSAGRPFASGTAFAIGPRGLFLTALHVVQDADQLSVQAPGRQALGADVVAVDTHHDVAVLSVPSMPAPGPAPLALGDSDTVRLGQGVVVMGYPLASPEHPTVTVTHGIVSGLRPDDGWVQIDASMNPGVSGGPVLTLDGRVIGIADAALRGAQQVNFAVVVNFARPLVLTASSGPLPTPLALPLTSPVAIPLAYTSGGIGPHSRRDVEGVSCVAAPPNAAEIDQVQAALSSQMGLHVVTWLSWAEGAPMNSELSFARLDATSSHNLGGATSQRLHLEPATICLNYSVENNSMLPFGQTFQVTYTLVYRVFRAPGAPVVP